MSHFPRFSRYNCQRLLKPLIVAAILLLEVCFGFGIAQAQIPLLEYPTWVRIGGSSPPIGTVLTSIYFSDTLHGVTTYTRTAYIIKYGNMPQLPGDPEIWYTLDARRWNKSTAPSSLAEVRVIRPINGKLYGAIVGQDIIVSTDQGVT